jgi:hypothetical protein
MRRFVWTAALMLAITSTGVAGRQSIVQGPRFLRGLTFESVAFEVPGDWMRNPRIRGRLEVSGGGRKDIDVLVLRESDLVAWERNKDVTPLHAARRVTRVELDVPLPGPDRYVVVLSNRFSKLASKEIAAEVHLTWEDDPSLPTGEALRRHVHFLDPPSAGDRQVIPVNDADAVSTVILERSLAGLPAIAVRRRQGTEPRVTTVGRYSGRVDEIGVVDVHGGGDRDVLIVGAGSDWTGTRRDLMLVCPRQLASLTLSLVWAHGSGASRPTVRYADGYAQARFAAEQSFLERIVAAYDSAVPDTSAPRRPGAPAAPRK